MNDRAEQSEVGKPFGKNQRDCQQRKKESEEKEKQACAGSGNSAEIRVNIENLVLEHTVGKKDREDDTSDHAQRVDCGTE
jgi:hypothetical protein